MSRRGDFNLISFILTTICIGLVISIGISVAYVYKYMDSNNMSLQDGIQDVTVSVKKVVNKFTNSGAEDSITLSSEGVNGTFIEQARNDEIVSDYYYYNQLSDNGKIMYNTIENNLNNMKSGVYTIDFGTKFNEILQTDEGKQQLKVDFQAAWDALALDNPKIFFIDVTKLYLTIESTTVGLTTTCTTKIGPEDNNSYLIAGIQPYYVDECEEKLEAIKNNVVANVNGSDYEKVKQVHDVLVDELEYDSSLNRIHTHNIYGALVEKSVVCEGYAKAFKYLLDALQIPCILVSGQGTNSKGETEEHIWNYVCLDGNWYAVDVTWDDPIVIGGFLTDSMKYRYFLKGEGFNTNHFPNNYLSNNSFRFEYPELSKNDY